MSVDAVVIGAGQAGLAAAYYLAQRSRRFVVLDADARVGDTWRRRWDSLRLITPVSRNGLPGWPFPGEPDYLASRDEVADYLEEYSRRFRFPITHRARVTSLRRGATGRGFMVESTAGAFDAAVVIVATGAFQRTNVPPFASTLSSAVAQIHADDYRSPDQVTDGPVLVVGAGNSGMQIARELSGWHHVLLSGPDPGTLPRRVFGRDVYDWVWPFLRLRTTRWLGRSIARRRAHGGHPHVGVSAADIAGPSLVRVGRTVGVSARHPVLDDGTVLEVRTVVWCTGYRPDMSWVDLPIFNADGSPDHRGGLIPSVPGLAFLGLPYQRRLNSGLIGGVDSDAREIVDVLCSPSSVTGGTW